MTSCFGMEESDEKNNPIHIGFNNSDDFIIILSRTSLNRYNNTLKMKDSLEKAQSFGAIAHHLELNMPEVLKIKDSLSIETFLEFIACSLRQQGIVLNNVALSLPQPETPVEKRVGLLQEAADVMRKSYKTYKGLNTPKNQKEASISLNNLEPILSQLGLGYSLCADGEKDPFKIIDLHIKALSLGKESYSINKTLEQEDQIKRQLMLALRQGFLVYDPILSNINIFIEPDTFAKYQTLTKNINLLEKVLSLFSNHLLDAPIKIDWHLESNFKSKKKYTKPQSQGPFSISETTLKKLPPVLTPENYMCLLWSTYSGMLKSASNTVVNLVGANEQLTALYKAKGQEHANLAIKTYRENVYQGEYKNNPEKEEEFIFAQLENLAENEKPLIDFYAKLRLEREKRREKAIAQMIRDEQEERKNKEEVQQKREAEERKALEERAAKQSALQTSALPEASHPYELVFSCEEKIEACVQKKVKVKTRGEAHPLFREIIEKDQQVIAIEPKIIILDPKNYAVFQSLVGQVYNRHITRDNVTTLLQKGFSCKIEHATGGGSHGKATAPNNCVWTIPPAWSGPIPALYRSELMNFLLVDMGMVEGLLEVKERK